MAEWAEGVLRDDSGAVLGERGVDGGVGGSLSDGRCGGVASERFSKILPEKMCFLLNVLKKMLRQPNQIIGKNLRDC